MLIQLDHQGIPQFALAEIDFMFASDRFAPGPQPPAG